MKVMIVMSLADQRGGAEIALRHLARDGRDQGIEWNVVFLEDGPMVKEFQGMGITAIVVPAGRLRHVHRYVRSVFQISSIARRERVDLVFSWMTKAHLYGGVAASIARLPSIWYQWGTPNPRDRLDGLATVLPTRGVIVTSKAAAAAQTNLRPVRSQRLVYPGIALSRFDPESLPSPRSSRQAVALPSDVPLVGFVGRLQSWKGAHVLIEAMPRVLQALPDAHCVIVGGKHDLEPDYPDHLSGLITTLGLQRNVTLAGFQTDVPKWMQAMDVIALPSSHEPFGITVIEAMALGKPVIAGDSGGPKEIVDNGVNATLIAHDDSAAIAEAITDYLLRPAFARQVAVAARERAKDFSVKRYVHDLATAIRDFARG